MARLGGPVGPGPAAVDGRNRSSTGPPSGCPPGAGRRGAATSGLPDSGEAEPQGDGGGSERLVMVENQTKTQWTLGERYRIYADAYGMYNSIPRLVARYTYTPKDSQ